MTHRTSSDIERGLATVAAAPRDEGTVQLVVRRPSEGQREILEVGELDIDRGLVGDGWIERPSRGSDGPDRNAQVTVMNARYAELIAGSDREAWAPAGDQLYIDMDISFENLPPGSQLGVGTAVIEFSSAPHTGCAQFSGRFGSDALRATNTERGRQLRLRGANAVVIQSGEVRPGDRARKL
jgi:MOSC domain-containing protein YiiM